MVKYSSKNNIQLFLVPNFSRKILWIWNLWNFMDKYGATQVVQRKSTGQSATGPDLNSAKQDLMS